MEDYVRRLNERFSNLEEPELTERFKNPENVDLFEEGAWQSARALSDEWREYIASVVANGISGDETKRIESRRILTLLREIDDTQIICLTWHLHKYIRDEAFFERHRTALEPIVTHVGSDRATFDAEAVRKSAHAQLLRLGLLNPRFEVPRGQELSKFDENTGTLKHGE